MPAINLDKKGISINSAEFSAIAANLQSNILKSHARDHARLLFLKFETNTGEVKSWIKKFMSHDKFVLSALDQQNDTAAFKSGMGSKTVANFYLTAKGYEQLGFDTNRFADGGTEMEQEGQDDEAVSDQPAIFGNNDFVSGMKSGKVNNKLNDPEVIEWEQEYTTDIHAMILLADADKVRLVDETNELKDSLNGIAAIIKEELGENIVRTLSGEEKIRVEHFGYADGISQPRYFMEDTRTSPVDLQPLSIVLVEDPFAQQNGNYYGSFLVYRKLEQDVAGFNSRITELAGNLHLTPNQQGKISKEDFAGALVVGRFKDGTPLVKSDIKSGEVPAFNDFKYEHVDRGAHKCPFHAHIRKTNPRGQGVLVSLKGRFITRRGIPYGNPDSDDKKGLLFMCFQSNLKRQFTFIQRAWSNAPGFPPLRGKPGIDPLIGQGHEGGQSWPVQYGSEHTTDFDFAGFVKMKGGEYFFCTQYTFFEEFMNKDILPSAFYRPMLPIAGPDSTASING